MSERPIEFDAAVELFVAQLGSDAPVGAREFAARFPHLAPDLVEALEAAEDLEFLRVREAEIGEDALERLGPFRIEGELGRGGMGVVFTAVEEPLGRRVALKLLPRTLLSSPSSRARFQREAVLASRLDHPGICTVFGAGATDGQPWIAMRLVEGRSLSESISAARAAGQKSAAPARAPGIDGPRAVADCIARAARALAFAHARGVLHRDVKPSNVIVTTDGQPVLLDFGVAIEAESDAPGLTRTGEMAGTPAYLAPELISGERARPDERCDVYALGVTLYECLTLAPPFAAPTRDALYRAVLAGAFVDVRRTNASVPRDLAVIVATAIARDPQQRYDSAAALASDLEAFVAGRSIAARPAGPIERAVSWARREPKRAVFTAAFSLTALALATVGGMFLASREDVRAGQLAQHARAIENDLVEAYTAIGDSHSKDAVPRFTAILERDPDNAEASVGLILARMRMHDDEQALELLRHAPNSPAFERLRAMALRQPAPPEDAAWLERASAFELFVDGEALRLEAERLPLSKRHDLLRVALARFDEAVARSPQARAAYHQARAWAASNLGDERATRTACTALAVLWPDSAWSLYQAGSTLAEFDPQRALELLRHSAELDPNRAQTFQCIGMAQYRLGQLEEAKAPLRRAFEINPLDAQAHNGLGAVYSSLGCTDEARAEFLEALAIDPRTIQAWANLSLLEPRGEAMARAVEHVLDIDPGQSKYRALYGSSLIKMNDLAGARDQFAILIAEAPENGAYWESYAYGLASTGDYRAGLDALMEARRIDPSRPRLEEFESELRAAVGTDD